jgi:nitroreductase
MTIIETIKQRKSCRAFKPDFLCPADKKILGDYMSENKKLIGGEVIEPSIIERKEDGKKMKLNYGFIQGHHTYLVGTCKTSPDSRVNYGYLLEKVVLKAAEIGVASCWIGYFDPAFFSEIRCENGFEIPSIVILGNSWARPTRTEKITRFAVNASKRLDWEKLFFNYNSATPLQPEWVPAYAESLEMLRLAPSAGNTQPWRVFFDDRTKEFHFFKKPVNAGYEKRGLHDIDLGIALSHFELTSSNNNLTGNWVKHSGEHINTPDDLIYMITWKCS